ncbi:hypothetical protein D3C72_2281290 [compost metagenome]
MIWGIVALKHEVLVFGDARNVAKFVFGDLCATPFVADFVHGEAKQTIRFPCEEIFRSGFGQIDRVI